MLKSYEDFVKLNKDNLDAAMAFGATLTKGFEEIYRETFGFAGKSLDSAVEASKALAAAKSPVDVANIQSKLVKDALEEFVTQSRKLTELTSETLKTALEPVGARTKDVMHTFTLKTV